MPKHPMDSPIKRTECYDRDLYEGSRSDLIREGIAKASWFPLAPVRDKRGRVKHTFHIGDVLLVEKKNGRWYVHLPISQHEAEARWERNNSAERAKLADNARASIEEARRKVSGILSRPFDPDSISTAERQLIQLWRVMPERPAEVVFNFAELNAARFVNDAPKLTLVVDNAGGEHETH